MNIGIIGYGKMGKTIERLAKKAGHQVVAIIDEDNYSEINQLKEKAVEVAIEFTRPESAFKNITTCLLQKIPIVSGTTSWLEHWDDVVEQCKAQKGAFFYASNYSIGVNIFFKLNRLLAKWMNEYPRYKVSVDEIHHIHKLDRPSGTAVTIASDLLQEHQEYDRWTLGPQVGDREIPVISHRLADVHGIHKVKYESEIDAISIKHEAFTREGFASGALQAAEWLPGKTGIFGMDDLLGE